MAKKRKGKPPPRAAIPKAAAASAAPDAAPSPAKPADAKPADAKPRARPPARAAARRAEEPAFWFGHDVAWAKLVVARVVLFGLLAIDALLQIRHAPRYGAGGFNVAQIPGLDALGPTRASYEIAQLVSAYLFVLAALGVATRAVLPCVTALYAWMYFTSQLDSYQHHYLVALILGISCFVPWQRPEDAEAGTKIRTWAIRLILVQLGILYLWAAISKMDAAWLDGRTLANQIKGPLRAVVDSSVGIKAAARFTIIVELALAFTVWIRPAWFIALPLGVLFHTGILLSGLEIGLFAWVMLAIYVLVVPDAIWVAIADSGVGRAVRRPFAALAGLGGDLATWIALLGGIAAAIAFALLCRFDHALVVAVVVGLVPIAIVLVGRLRGSRSGATIGVAHAVAILLWLVVDRATTVTVDYYRYWAGSTRRLGETETSEVAYHRLLELAPDDEPAHYNLGRLLLRRGEEADGLAELHTAQALEPKHARNFIAEAQYLAGKGKKAEATEKAREATYAEPDNQQAKDLLATLSGTAKGKPPAAGDDDDGAP